MCEVIKYRPSTWFTYSGALKKQREIENQGIPDMSNWRFITLTFDQTKFYGPRHAYELGRKQVRRFVYRFFDQIGGDKFCAKLEFQANGWPHWHLAINVTDRLTKAQLKLVREMWAFAIDKYKPAEIVGRTNVKRIKSKRLDYMFKYIYKPAKSMTEENETAEGFASVPDWFADWRDPDTLETYQRARFWSTSKNFYTGIRPKAKPAPVKDTCKAKPQTVREKIFDYYHRFKLNTFDKFGRVISHVIDLKIPYSHYEDYILRLLCLGKATTSTTGGYIIERDAFPVSLCKQEQKTSELCQKCNQKPCQTKLNQLNRLLQLEKTPF